ARAGRAGGRRRVGAAADGGGGHGSGSAPTRTSRSWASLAAVRITTTAVIAAANCHPPGNPRGLVAWARTNPRNSGAFQYAQKRLTSANTPTTRPDQPTAPTTGAAAGRSPAGRRARVRSYWRFAATSTPAASHSPASDTLSGSSPVIQNTW